MTRTPAPARYDTAVDFTVRIPTRSGVTLGATLTRPVSDGRFPALVWYDPYRGAWDGQVGANACYFAARGYVFVNLHARGTGNSEGVHLDEYTEDETRDGYDAIEWLAAQPWCSGAVGMLGTSYSGFTCLQVAALTPPSLKAIAPAYFTDRRYTDDCHYKGGCLRGYYDTLTYGLNMVARNALPPHPLAVGEQWADLWEQRLREGEPYLLKWLQHPVEDEYWATGSVIGRYDRIQAAALLIGGWNDGYPTPPLRTFRALEAPKKLLIGPWSHAYGDVSHCGPRIHIHHELLLWWDRWLKDEDNGVDREPRVQIFVPEWEPPIRNRTMIRGEWHCADDLPTPAPHTWRFGADPSHSGWPREQGADRYEYRPGASPNGGIWDAGVPFRLPGDQRPDEALAINYTSPPLAEELLILGEPRFTAVVSASQPVMPLAVRLCDVGPGGTSVIVTRGLLNLTRRHGMDCPEPMPVDTPEPVTLDLEGTAWRFRKGHRLRLSINGSDFPNVWPTPLQGEVRLHLAEEDPTLVLPIWPNAEPLPFEFLPSEAGVRAVATGDAPAWRVIHDVLEDRLRFVMANGNEFVVSDRTPAEAWTRSTSRTTAAWPGAVVRAEATASLTSDARAIHLVLSLNVWLNEVPHYQERWRQSVSRNLL